MHTASLCSIVKLRALQLRMRRRGQGRQRPGNTSPLQPQEER